MPTDKKSYTYGPMPMTAAPTRQTALDRTKARPVKSAATGKYGGIGRPATGGSMNGGGKRRANRMSR